jgi:hypothetical protein
MLSPLAFEIERQLPDVSQVQNAFPYAEPSYAYADYTKQLIAPAEEISSAIETIARRSDEASANDCKKLERTDAASGRLSVRHVFSSL